MKGNNKGKFHLMKQEGNAYNRTVDSYIEILHQNSKIIAWPEKENNFEFEVYI